MDIRHEVTNTNRSKAKPHREYDIDDLPDITPSIMKKNQTLWKVDYNSDVPPVKRLVQAFRAHYNIINPYFTALQKANGGWYQHWLYLYEIAQQLETAINANKQVRIYSVPHHMDKLRTEAHHGVLQAKINYDHEFEKYLDHINVLQEEIAEIKKAINLIAEAKEMDALSVYDHAAHPSAGNKKPGLSSFFSSIFKRPAVSVPANLDANEKDRQLMMLRDRLLVEFNANLRLKLDELERYSDYSAPVKADNYEREEENAMATIRHDKLSFYCCQTRDVMLHCLRLYAWAMRTYILVYGVDPVVEYENALAPHAVRIVERVSDKHDYADVISAKARDMFRQMVVGMKNNLDNFYCNQPDPVYFATYYGHFSAIKEREIRQAILTNGAKSTMLSLIFKDYEEPAAAMNTMKK